MLALARMIALVAAVLAMAAAGATPVSAQTAKLKVASTSKEIVDNLPFYVGIEAGLFKKQDLDLELTHFAGGGEVVRAVASNATDIGMVATTAGVIAIGRGEPLKLFSGWTAPAYGILWIVPADSPIKTIKDLAGQKAGFTRPGSVSHTGFNAALQANGLQGKVDLIPVGSPGDSWAALKAGRVQASWHTAPDVYSILDRGEARILFQISDYLKEYQQGSLIATEDYLRKNGETARKFLRAIAAANDLIAANPADAAKMGAKHMGAPEVAVRKTLDGRPLPFYRIGAPEQANLNGSIAEAMETGALKERPSYDKLVDKSYLP
jgi:NitT/TauT family transport system substrate-binding protein